MSGEKVDAAEIGEYPRNAWERAKMRRYFLRLGEFRSERRRKRFVEHLRRLHGVARSAELLKAHGELQRKRELRGQRELIVNAPKRKGGTDDVR